MSDDPGFAQGLAGFARDIALSTKAHVREAIAAAVAPLEARVRDLEQRRGLLYKGTWSEQDAASYVLGDVTTHKGAAWCAVEPPGRGRPGESRAWQLMVKSGRDGRDLR